MEGAIPQVASQYQLIGKQRAHWVLLSRRLLLIALVLVFMVAPRAQDQAGGDVQRIFYFHVSSAWNGFGAWLVTAVTGALYLKRET